MNDLCVPINIEKYPDSFIEIIKGTKQAGWSSLFDRFMGGSVCH